MTNQANGRLGLCFLVGLLLCAGYYLPKQERTLLSKLDAVQNVITNELSQINGRLNTLETQQATTGANTQTALANGLNSISNQLKKVEEFRIGLSRQNEDIIRERVIQSLGKADEDLRLNIIRQAEKQNTLFTKDSENYLRMFGVQIRDNITQSLGNAQAIQNQRLDEIKNSIIEIRTQREKKKQTFLDMARTGAVDEEATGLLYSTAIGYSEDKAPVLAEYGAWQKKRIEKALSTNQVPLANELLGDTTVIFDSAMGGGTINDIKAIPKLKATLQDMKTLIDDKQKTVVSEQEKILSQTEEAIKTCKTIDACNVALKDLTALPVDSSLEARKESLLATIQAKQSCLTTSSDPIIVPAIDANTPWVEWVANFNKRISDNSTAATKRMEDLGTAAEFLVEAKTQEDEILKPEISKLEANIKQLSVSCWSEQVACALSTNNWKTGKQAANLNEVAELINQADGFSDIDYSNNRDKIAELNKYLIKKTIAEIDSNIQGLREQEALLRKEDFIQLIGGVQAQCLQLLMRMALLETKHPGALKEEIACVGEKTKGLKAHIEAYEEARVASELKKNEGRRKVFVEWARDEIDAARKLNEDGEKIASQWTKTTANPEAGGYYKQAWERLIRIHPGDLSSADPALYEAFQKLKTQNEKRREPSYEELRKVNYRGIND